MHQVFGSRLRSMATFFVVVVMLAGSFTVSGAAAAQSQTVTSQLTGVTITYGPPYQLQTDIGYADETVEMIAFMGSADILAMGFLPALIDLNGARDLLLDSIFGELQATNTIDRGDYEGVSYSLDIVNLDGQEMGVFSLFMNQRAHGFSEFYIYIAPPSLFTATMQTMQNSIAVDGEGVLNGVDATAMGNMVIANVGSTGGTAVTNVTEVQADSTQTASTNTSTTSTAGRDEYLQQIQVEFEANTASLGQIIQMDQQLTNKEITPEAARPILDQAHAELAGANDRAAAITPPAGMEDFHQQFVTTANDLTTLGTSWVQFTNQEIDSATYTAVLSTALESYVDLSELLEAEMNSSGSSTTTSTSETKNSTQTTSSNGEAEEYLAAVQAQRDAFRSSFTTFVDTFSQISAENSDQVNGELVQLTVDEAESWQGYLATAQSLTPPPGYEGVQAAYEAWAGEVVTLGDTWLGFLQEQGDTIDDFNTQVDNVDAAESTLDSAISEAGSSSASSTETTTSSSGNTRTTRSSTAEETSEATQASGTTRTTRSTTTEETPEATEATGTTRTTRSTTTEETPEATEASGTSRTTRTSTGDTGSTTNLSETKGSSGNSNQTENSSGSEWVGTETGLTIAWDETFALDEQVDEPTSSNAEYSEDAVYLVWQSQEGASSSVSVTVYNAPNSDASNGIGSLVEGGDDVAVQEAFGDSASWIIGQVDAQNSGLLIHFDDDSGRWMWIQVACLNADCSQQVNIFVTATGDDMPEAIDAVLSGVTVDGESISPAVPTSEIETKIAEISAQ